MYREEMLSMQGRKVRVEFPNGDRTFGLSAIEGKYSEGSVGDFALMEEEANYKIIDLPTEEPENLFAVVKDSTGIYWLKDVNGWRMQDQESHWWWAVVEDHSPLTVVFEGVETE